MLNLPKAMDKSNASARVDQTYEQLQQFYQIHVLQDLQLIDKTWNHTENQEKGHTFWGDQ